MTFTKIGKKYSRDREREIIGFCDNMQWQDIPVSVGAMPGLAIKEAIRVLNLPKAYQIAVSHDMAPYGLYGIRCRYKEGPAEVFVVDDGCECSPVAHRLIPDHD